ncbi:unnamed protein product [Lactuca virosa]|uniref:Filament-like plant protein 4 n=1 Tax=Lactuca virosa TaxID=75947 RepID=A0AAU9MZ33_9ASTR|nr:unnamed protein product [Lactuca virosa]
MDRRSWPWKKKSSDKAVVVSESVGVPSSAASQSDKVKQDSYKKPNYVQISVESYSHLTGLEDQVKSYEDQMKSYEDQVKSYDEQVKRYEDQQLVYEDQIKNLEDEVKELNEQLSEAHSEMTTKENLVKQHAKVAEEAVCGWEKAEAEAATLKNHLESVTLLKLTAEDRASHLDGALKECMRQIRNLKEEHEQIIHDVVLAKTKQWDKLKLEFDTKISNLDQELMRSAADNAAISRSLQERSNMLIKMSEEKSEKEAEIERLKSDIESCEREINSLKYELHIVAKELEIRNEEKNMSVRSADVANKQHLEGVRKIAKLEAECQRLRGLVRKKLPGPAALAQMKLEVDSLGRDYGESRVKRSPVKPPSPHSPHSQHSQHSQSFSSLPDFTLDSLQNYKKENEMLTERILGMEEETKMLKEALAKRNTELQASRNICAKTVSKLQSLESQVKGYSGQIQNASNAPSVASFSEEGNDDEVSVTGSWATALISELTHNKKDNNNNKIPESPQRSENANNLELMDDFLEMEKLATDSVSKETPETEELNPKGINVISHDDQELGDAISGIYNFVMTVEKEAKSVVGIEENGFVQKVEGFSVIYKEIEDKKVNLQDFVVSLSGVLGKADSTSDPDIPHENENSVPTSETTVPSWKCSFEEFEELKLEKEKIFMDLEKCNENLENTKLQLSETELSLSEVKSQLTNAQKSNGLFETQLKCMAESYNSLEVRANELQNRVNVLEEKITVLDNELEEEKKNHKETEEKCKDLLEQLQRIETETTPPPVAETDGKSNQERELAAAAEKLAECQETIFLLGKQLKGMRPPTTEFMGSPIRETSQKSQTFTEEDEEDDDEVLFYKSKVKNLCRYYYYYYYGDFGIVVSGDDDDISF